MRQSALLAPRLRPRRYGTVKCCCKQQIANSPDLEEMTARNGSEADWCTVARHIDARFDGHGLALLCVRTTGENTNHDDGL